LAYLNWGALERGESPKQPRQRVETIQALVNWFLSDREVQAEAGQLSRSSFSSDKYRLASFLSYCNYKGKSALREVLSAEFLGNYKNALLLAKSRNETSAVSVKHNLRTLKACIEWGYDNELVDRLPRKLRTLATVKLEAPTPEFLSIKEVQELFKAASQRTKLYIAVALNCGYTQQDIASLEHSMIDWQEGVIERDRHKTGKASKHKLWKVTLDLLRQEATDPDQSDLVLLSPRKKPLILEQVNAKGNPTRTDTIRQAFQTLRKKVGTAKPFKVFRKTGADMIERQYPQTPWLASQYLAHSEGGVKKHYVQNHYDLLFEALAWLETQFNLKLES